MIQRSLTCGCGNEKLFARGRCLPCWRAWRRDLRLFSGHREETLQRERTCRICAEIERRRLVVHHVAPRDNRAFATLCRRCHPRVHFLYQPPAFASEAFRVLWRKLHQGQAEQLALPFCEVEIAEQGEFFTTA